MFLNCQVISTVAAACVMDRLGRRILLCVSALFMMISISLLGISYFIPFNKTSYLPSSLQECISISRTQLMTRLSPPSFLCSRWCPSLSLSPCSPSVKTNIRDFIFFICDLIGFGPIPWLMMSELFSPEVSILENILKVLITIFCRSSLWPLPRPPPLTGPSPSLSQSFSRIWCQESGVK